MPFRKNLGFKWSLRVERAATVRRRLAEYSVERQDDPVTEVLPLDHLYGRWAALDGGATEGEGIHTAASGGPTMAPEPGGLVAEGGFEPPTKCL